MFHASWPSAARELVGRAIDRHGGQPAWEQLGTVRASLESIDGFLLRAKGVSALFREPRAIVIDARANRVDFADYPARGQTGIYERGDVRVVGGRESVHHRRTFAGARRKLGRWDEIDALYFFGYALTSYVTFPFALPALRFVDGGRSRVTVEFPEGADVHSRVQTFHFDRSGLIVRNDYVATVAGPWWRGAHAWEDPVFVGGIAFPRRRRVLPRLGRWRLPFPAAVDAKLDRFEISVTRDNTAIG